MQRSFITAWNPPSHKALMLGAAVTLALLLFVGTLAQWRLPRFLVGGQPIGPQSSGPAAAWKSMVALAFQEAAKIDTQAALSDVGAYPPGRFDNIAYTGPVTGSLLVRFNFYRPDGDSFWVDLEDAAPAKTLFVYPGSGPRPNNKGMYDWARATDQTYRQEVQSAKLPPRDAVQRTWNLARQEADRHGLHGGTLEPELGLISLSRWNEPGGPKWEMGYWLVPAPTPKGQPTATPLPSDGSIVGRMGDLLGLGSMFGVLVVGYDVDATSGQVIDTHHFLDDQAAPTPTP